jgi:FixJ family two-component response regulator
MVKKIKPAIYIVDDDASIRRAMKRLIRSTGMDVQVFSSAREFLKFKYRRHNSCMIVDISLEGKSGLELQEELRSMGSDLPVIFITGFDSPETIPRRWPTSLQPRCP